MKAAARGPIALALAAALQQTPAAAQETTASLLDLSLEQLANLEITSVARRPQPLSRAPASIYVITGEDIRRAGVTTLPEALRLAPNLQVARIDAGLYAISARGFNNTIGNKLLVLVDGRTIYTPLFSGVFWDQQDLLLEDVERIEVISGPGATLWGANAVNGVINVITKGAAETQGVLAKGFAGNWQHGAAVRAGGEIAGGHYRFYVKAREQENTRFETTDASKADQREHVQAGFRADWRAGADAFTLQGDAYSGRGEDPGLAVGLPVGRHEVEGANLLGRWTRSLAGGSHLRVQAYLDHAKREDRLLFQPDSSIFDIEAQHGIPYGRHRFLWGGGYRKGKDNVADGLLSGFRPMRSELDWTNVFVQDEIRLSERLAFTAGLKLEENDYTGTEHLPSARLAWTPSEDRLVWAAVSRAVRAPSRFDRDVVVPFLPGFSLGGPNFVSEVAYVYELGVRANAGANATFSATLFRHEWDRLRSGTLPPLMIENRIEGPVHGLEAWSAWQASPRWRLSGGFFVLRKHLRLEPGSTDPVGVDNVTLANDPEFQWLLRASADLGGRRELDVMVRRVGELPEPRVRAYTAVDVRFAWRPGPGLELSASLRNALDPEHPEFRPSDAQPPAEIERELLLQATWTY